MIQRKLRLICNPTAVGAFALMVCGFAAQGFAGEVEVPEAVEKPAFEQLDADGNGQITQEEAKDTWLAAEFATVDLDQDGMVNRIEYESAIG